MKIVHVNYYDIQGGAAKAAYRLHHGLIEAGYESIMLVAEKKSNDNSVISAFPSRKIEYLHIKQRFESFLTIGSRKLHKFPHALNLFDAGLVKQINALNADIVNLHWINGCMLSIKEIAQIKAPIVWTLHDAWAYCGAEHHHILNDNRFRNGYDKSSFFNLNRYVWKQKCKYWSKLNINIVAPSTWLGREAAQSHILGNKIVKVIHNGIDLNIFNLQSKNKHQANEKKVIAFGAFSLDDWNKGGKELLDALRVLRDIYCCNFELLLIGNGQFDNEFKYKNTGFIVNDSDMANIYPQADAFVLASKYDNLPNMLVEALACGVPTVSFNTGGIPDIIEHKKNGYLAKAFDHEDLARGLNFVLNDKFHNQFSINARLTAKRKFDIKHIVQFYMNFYRTILA